MSPCFQAQASLDVIDEKDEVINLTLESTDEVTRLLICLAPYLARLNG